AAGSDTAGSDTAGSDTAGSDTAASEKAGPGQPGRRPLVRYAPTWEGGQPSMAYSSVVSHGEALLRSLLDSGRYDVIYRPHPRTGANRAEFAAADQRLRALVRQHRERDPQSRHAVDLAPAWDLRADDADLLVCDISAVAGDWMTTGKPIVVTIPESPQAFLDADTVLSAAPGLRAAEAGTVADLVAAELTGGGDPARRSAWVEHAMGDTTPGAAISRFLDVCDELIELRRRELAARTARLTGAGR
ncbi:MAG TPA: CDP-glycerol glycerophosphotransferase family protein, partial [Jatrophihabitans sp.]